MNKNMIHRLIYTIMTLTAMAVLFFSCQQDVWTNPLPTAPEGYVAIQFNTDIPVMEKVTTRSVDPDGGGVQNMTLFCFDRYGLFITTVSATTDINSTTTGSFTAQVPDHARIIHFVANQVMTNFNENEFQGKAEAEVMALLEGSSGRMIYWARFACDDSDDKINVQLENKYKNQSIPLLRNHAKVSVAKPKDNGHFIVTGFAVYNTNAFGTVAPYHPEKGFNFTEEEWIQGSFVTLPARVDKLSDVTDVTNVSGRYIFECENGVDDPVSVILKGHNIDENEEKYYRVMLMQDGEQIPLRRNHDYQIHIEGPLSFGQNTFAAALEAAATNNVWISISDQVNEVQDQNYILTVAQTDYVLDAQYAGNAYTLTYTITGKNGKAITENDKAQVTWLDNDVARYQFEHRFAVENGVGKGSIIVHLNSLGSNEKLEGTLLVKHGQLQRKIKVITVKKQSFVPSWVGTQVYGVLDSSDPTKNRSHVTVMFTVPESCPEELFPLKTYISVAGLDIRAASGMALTVVRDGDKDWFSSGSITPEPDYKYLYIVEKPGVQRVYFENVLNQPDEHIATLYIEAEHFEMMDRKFTYSDDKKSITVEGLKAYDAQGGGTEGSARDELVLYRLVPQKKHANVQFDLQLRIKTGDMQGELFNAGPKDEFLLYSQFLDFYTDKEIGQVGVTAFDCIFYPEESEKWWRKYNPNAGRMLMFKPRQEIVNNPPDGIGKYTIYLKTNCPQSAEVIRIASNFGTQQPILPEDADTDGMGYYGGDSYRSVTFELANYNPFRFGARLSYRQTEYGQNDEPDRTGIQDIPEVVTSTEWTYEPEQAVEIAFDVTSFKGSDGKSVDPFGEVFEIYIDAPMLKLDETQNSGLNGKLKEVEDQPGRFVYTVDEDRNQERKYFSNSQVVNRDELADQNGERKTLYFKVKDIVSAGDIVLSSNKDQVVFYSKTFRISNQSIVGTLSLEDKESVPENAFIAFEKVSDNSRIGVVTVKADGTYELRLRKEYSFNWNTDKVRFHYETNGTEYYYECPNLAELFSSPAVVLKKNTQAEQPQL